MGMGVPRTGIAGTQRGDPCRALLRHDAWVPNCQTMRCSTALAALLLLATPAAAESVRAHYRAYAAGLPVAALDADWDVQPGAYQVRLGFRTLGALALAYSGGSSSTAEGRFEGARALPRRFYSAGTIRGAQRVTQIDYPRAEPQVRQLVPPNDDEREPVPPADQAGTIDSLSALALLVRTVNETGRCDGGARTFDGRRLGELAVRTGPVQTLDPTGRSTYSGPALRCDFEGRQLGGFIKDGDQAALRRPQRGTAWFAALTPGGPKVPVRIEVQTRWVGAVTMYLAEP